MHIGAAVLSSVILGLLAVFQLGLALGAPWGRFAWGGQHDGRLPGSLRVGSAVSIGIYALFAAILLDRAGVMHAIPSLSVARVGSWVLVGYFTLGVVMNGISRSKGERAVMTPTSLALAVGALLVAAGPQA
jgi:hypothetical protein